MFTTAEGIRTTVDEFQVADIKAKTTLDIGAVPAGATSITWSAGLEGFQPGMTIRIDRCGGRGGHHPRLRE